MPVNIILWATLLFNKDVTKPRYELKSRPVTSADQKRHPQHIFGTDRNGKETVVTRIRALQGHSTKVRDGALGRVKIGVYMAKDMPIMAHATKFDCLEPIQKYGLLLGGFNGSRDQNHFLPVDLSRRETLSLIHI